MRDLTFNARRDQRDASLSAEHRMLADYDNCLGLVEEIKQGLVRHRQAGGKHKDFARYNAQLAELRDQVCGLGEYAWGANVATGPNFSIDEQSPDVIEHRGRFYINMGRPGFNSRANNSSGYRTERVARSAMAHYSAPRRGGE